MTCQYLKRPGNTTLAYHYTPGDADTDLPMVFFLGGFKSDMAGTKATFLEAQCRSRGQGYLRFDYSGHGESDGQFKDGTISGWTQDAMDMLDHIAPDRVVLVGSSMGGWIALLLALKRRNVVFGVVGIAAAPDFTLRMWDEILTQDQRAEVEEKGFLTVDNDYSDDPYIFTKALFDDGRKNSLLGQTQKIAVPVSLIQGMLDPDVPWETTAQIQKSFEGAEIDVVLIDDGDHRLSRPSDLDIIDREVLHICKFKDEE